jgi:hypothetical protein
MAWAFLLLISTRCPSGVNIRNAPNNSNANKPTLKQQIPLRPLRHSGLFEEFTHFLTLLLCCTHAAVAGAAYPGCMTQSDATQSYIRFYDQVLSEISSGKVEQGINILVGMLDAIALQEGALEQARRALQSHLLHRMLLEDPICAFAAERPGDSRGLAAIIADKGCAPQISSTGLRLFAATSSQPIARAILSRQVGMDRLLARVGMAGIAVRSERPQGFKARGLLDIICASDAADRLKGPALGAELASLRTSLSGQGRIILSAALPDHLGAGWRSICLNWNPQTHDEQSLTQAAAMAGLTAHTYRDEADCFVWAELRPAQNSQQEGDESNGY